MTRRQATTMARSDSIKKIVSAKQHDSRGQKTMTTSLVNLLYSPN